MEAVELCGYGVEHTPLDTAVYLILHKTANMKVPMTYSQNSHAKDTIFRSSQKVLNSELFFCSECVLLHIGHETRVTRLTRVTRRILGFFLNTFFGFSWI
jgi:hypothetical protein